ncbi:hypothetical protein DPMN_019691 [Dreissena polymorpha]|uniref:Uncharacterized protein n=1 Tax=Dreissena polymorpha TaxID=45954 RepID=A0A9D4NJR4_DREPO|nr:hypothetical protein DPMN_019691 [Dreissena polymorpha]
MEKTQFALKYVTYRVLTRFNYSHFKGKFPCTLIHNKDWTINDKCFAKFHEDFTKHVISRVLTTKNVPPSGSHFHYNLTINVTSRVETGRPTDGSVFQPTRTIF